MENIFFSSQKFERKFLILFERQKEQDLGVASPQLFVVDLSLVLNFSSWVPDIIISLKKLSILGIAA